MLTAPNYRRILSDLSRYNRSSGLRIAGIVFARPESPLAREEIYPSIGYYHFRSGPATNFYFAGFDQHSGGHTTGPVITDEEAGIRWAYSARSFDGLRRELERHTSWTYSGGCDLLVTGVSFARSTGQARLDFSSSVTARLDTMRADGVMPRIDTYFENLFRFAESYQGAAPAAGAFSNAQGMRLTKQGLRDLLVSALPEGMRAEARNAFHFAARDISRRPV